MRLTMKENKKTSNIKKKKMLYLLIKEELYLNTGTVNVDTDPDGTRVDVRVAKNVFDKVPHLLEVYFLYAGARVNNNNKICPG